LKSKKESFATKAQRHEDCFKAFRPTEWRAEIQTAAALLASHPFDGFDKLTAGRLRAWLVRRRHIHSNFTASQLRLKTRIRLVSNKAYSVERSANRERKVEKDCGN